MVLSWIVAGVVETCAEASEDSVSTISEANNFI
jgi:hypothetical protein